MEWQDAIIGALTVAVLGAFARLAMRPPQVVAGDVVLRYAPLMRWLLGFGVVLFLAVLVAVVWPLLGGKPTEQEVRTAGPGIPFCILLCVGSFGERRVALRVDRDGIGGRTAFRGRRHIAWKDVVSVRWAAANQWFVLVDRRGERLRVSRFLQGHQVVPAMLRERVPEPVWRDAVAAWERAVGSQ